MQVAGQVIAQMSGMALADVIAPGSDNQLPLFSSMLNMTAMAVFVIIGGHRALDRRLDAHIQHDADRAGGRGGVDGRRRQ